MNIWKRNLKQFSIGMMVTLSFICTKAFADGDRVGNGGDAVLCYTDGKTKAMTLDYYEMENQTLMKNHVEELPGNHLDKVRAVIKRTILYNPFLSARMEKYLQIFINSHLITESSYLVDIADSDISLIQLPPNCWLVQAAIQVKKPEPFTPKFLIERETWELMDETQKAGLVLHEILYLMFLDGKHEYDRSFTQREFIYRFVNKRELDGKENSDLTRKFVRVLSSEQFHIKMSQKEFNEMIKLYHPYFGVDTIFKGFEGHMEQNIDSKTAWLEYYFTVDLEDLGFERSSVGAFYIKPVFASNSNWMRIPQGHSVINHTISGSYPLYFEKGTNFIFSYKSVLAERIQSPYGTVNCQKDAWIILNKNQELVGCNIEHMHKPMRLAPSGAYFSKLVIQDQKLPLKTQVTSYTASSQINITIWAPDVPSLWNEAYRTHIKTLKKMKFKMVDGTIADYKNNWKNKDVIDLVFDVKTGLLKATNTN